MNLTNSRKKWITLNYGGDPDTISEENFQEMIKNWEGYEAAGIEFMFVNWVLSEKEKKRKN